MASHIYPFRRPDTDHGPMTGVSSLLRALDLSTSLSTSSIKALCPMDASRLNDPTTSYHSDGKAPDKGMHGTAPADLEATSMKSVGHQDIKERAEDTESDIFEAARDDLRSIYYRLRWNGDDSIALPYTFEQRKVKARLWLMNSLCHDALTTERIDAIEQVLETKGFMQAPEAPKMTETKSQQRLLQRGTLLSAKLEWVDFTTCEVDTIDAECFALLLVGKPLLSRSQHREWQRRHTAGATKVPDANLRVERICFPTTGASYVFEEFMGPRIPARDEAILRPFKPLFVYYHELQARYTDGIDSTVAGYAGSAEDLPSPLPTLEREEDKPAHGSVHQDVLDEEQTRDNNKLVTGQAILNLMRDELKDDLELHLEYRERKKSSILFDDLWHLFFPGDIVYDPKLDQALQVLCVQNGRTVLETALEQQDADYTNTRMLGAKNELAILTFSMDFDGQTFGPAQRSYSIDAWEGEQMITSLAIYPVEYETTEDLGSQSVPSTKIDLLRRRGRKFCEIVNTSQVAHRQYRGHDIGRVREQIDSDVIVDVGFYYEQNPSEAPVLGLTHPPPGDKREVIDNTHYMDPDKGANVIFDDRELEAERMTAFVNSNSGNLLQRTQIGVDLTEARQLLLPRGLWAYVFRNRKWYQLDVNLVQPLEQNHQSFDDLVLQSDHKRLVQSLVKNHSTGIKPTGDSVGRIQNDRREDLVRGKGKGVIILLHGVPGVGKSSTAECVAEYTRRPLLSITCGDIGQSAEEVQNSLELHLNLAHRWGCVMLLDEADVFLAARDKRDLQRNAVVSVFLRVLEYYSGILFLTTNKVGAFDEAFKSRIHLSLYYDKLSADQTWKIWDVNLKRQMKLRPHLSIDKEELLRWGEKNYRQCRRDGTQIWNGRQIRNACQTAAALAEADEKGTMHVSHLEAVAKASLEFDKYLEMVYGGDDADRVRRAGEREDSYTTYSGASQAYHDDDRYSDYYRDRDYGYEPPRRASHGPRAFRDDRVRERFDGRGSDREDGRYAERQRSPADARERPRV